jgi:hypothetical protein
MDKQIEKAPNIMKNESEHYTYCATQIAFDHDYYMKAFEGYKSPEEVEAIRVEAQHLAIENLIRETETSAEQAHSLGYLQGVASFENTLKSAKKQARQDAFKEAAMAIREILDDKRNPIKTINEYESGQHPGEKKE